MKTISVKLNKFRIPFTDKPVEMFVWGPEKEDAQQDIYLDWLNRNITLQAEMQFFPANTDKPCWTITIR